MSNSCPHLDHDDRRCAHRFNLTHLESLFDVCCDRFESCSTYHSLSRESREGITRVGGGATAPFSTIRLTIDGLSTHL